MADSKDAKLSLTYALLEGPQEAILMTEDTSRYGIVGCPSAERYLRVPGLDMDEFSSYVEEFKDALHGVFNGDSISEEQRMKISGLIKTVLKVEEREVVPTEAVSEVLTSLGLAE